MVLRLFIAAIFIFSFSSDAEAFFGRRSRCGGGMCGQPRMCSGGGRSCGSSTRCGSGGCGVVRVCGPGGCNNRPVCGGGGRSCGGGNRFADSGVFTGDQFGGGFQDLNRDGINDFDINRNGVDDRLEGIGTGIDATGNGGVFDPTVGGGQLAPGSSAIGNGAIGNGVGGNGAGFVPTNVGSGRTPQATGVGATTGASATPLQSGATSATAPAGDLSRHLVRISPQQSRNGRGGMGVVIDPNSTDPNLNSPRQIFLAPNGQPFIFDGQNRIALSPRLTAELARRYNSSRGVQRSPEDVQLINRFLGFANQGAQHPVQPIGAVSSDGQSTTPPGGHGGGAGDTGRKVDNDTVWKKWATDFNTAEKSPVPPMEKVSEFVGKYRTENDENVSALYQECVSKSDPTKKVPATVFIVNKEDKDGKKVPAITITAGHKEAGADGKLQDKVIENAKKFAHELSATEAKPEAGLYAKEDDWESLEGGVSKEVYLKKLKDADADGKPQYFVQLVLKRAPTKAKEISPNDEVFYCKRTPQVEKKDPEQKKEGEESQPEQPQMSAVAVNALKACASCHSSGGEGVGFLQIKENGEVKYVGDRNGEEITAAQLADAIQNGGMDVNAIGKLKKAGLSEEEAKKQVEELRAYLAGETAPKKKAEASETTDSTSTGNGESASTTTGSWLDSVQNFVTSFGDRVQKAAEEAKKKQDEQSAEAESYDPDSTH